MRRRDVLKSFGTLAGAGAASRLLPGCGDAGTNRRGDGSGSEGPPDGITTLVVVMMENRTYDHYLGARSLIEGLPGNGLTADMVNPDVDDTPVAIYRETDYCIPDPPHGWERSHLQFNQGLNDGFMRTYREVQGDGVLPYVMGYFGREDIPLTWAIADQYASCDAWFASVMGPTWPNRFYLHSGQSGGLTQNLILPTWRAIEHQLTDAGVPWAYYFSDMPFLILWRDIPVEGTVKPVMNDFFIDAKSGALPPVTFVEPAFTLNDDHPPHHPMLGQAFLASVYAALASSPQWNNTLLVITYDEHGGFFDHVAPPLAVDDRAAEGFDQLGFRVPTVVAGPYVKSGHVSSVVRDHSSVLAHISHMFDLEPLTARVAAAEDLSELLDEERLDARAPAPPAEMPAIEVDESSIEAECIPGSEPSARTDIELMADRGFFPRRFDRRAQAREYLFGIGEALDRLNAGRIRRGR